MEPSPQHRAWVNPQAGRYYQVYLERDLFGDWTVLRIWGGIGSNRGRTHHTGVGSYAEGLQQVEEAAKRRVRHGYVSVPVD